MQKYWVTVDDKGNTRWHKDANCTVFHRVGGPAVIWANGDRDWYLNDRLHRTDGPAVEYLNGTKAWWLNGLRHREDGPAIEWADGDKMWYLNGTFHRTDGPAIEYASGTKEWWLNGEEVTYEEHAHRVNPAQEMTVAEIEKLLGKRIKIIK